MIWGFISSSMTPAEKYALRQTLDLRDDLFEKDFMEISENGRIKLLIDDLW